MRDLTIMFSMDPGKLGTDEVPCHKVPPRPVVVRPGQGVFTKQEDQEIRTLPSPPELLKTLRKSRKSRKKVTRLRIVDQGKIYTITMILIRQTNRRGNPKRDFYQKIRDSLSV